MVVLAHSFYLARDPKQCERAKPYPPLTTLLAAAMLRERGEAVRLFDATFAGGPAEFAAALEHGCGEPVLIIEDTFNFLTKMCTETRRADALAMVGMARAEGRKVAVCGPDADDNPQLYLDAGAAAVMVGEGEFTAGELVDAWRRGDDPAGVAGLILPRAGGGVRRTAPRRQPRDLDALPAPAWDLVDAGAYRRTWLPAHGYLSWNMAASRGCPYACNWCAKPTFGRRYSQRSAASVAEELAQLKRAVDPDHVWFADDIFGMTEAWIVDFAGEVVARDAVTPFAIQTRTNLIDDRVAAALAAAGAEEVWLGVETGSQRVLDAMDKGATVDAARLATRALRRAGVRAGWFLQLGYPPEDWDDILATRDLVHDEAPDEIGVSVAYPLPGTVFHARVTASLGARRNWRDTGELAMLFPGRFGTAFYRDVRDALHADAAARTVDAARWEQLRMAVAA